MSYTMNDINVYFDNRLGGEIGSEMELQMVLHMCRAFELAGYNADRPFDEHLAASMEARAGDDCPPHGIDRPNDGIWHHDCERFDCGKVVIYDDEPYCFEHSPDSGSSVAGYSAREDFYLRNPAWLDDAM